jgi:hypothetical protein
MCNVGCSVEMAYMIIISIEKDQSHAAEKKHYICRDGQDGVIAF